MDKIICVGKNYLEHAQELGDKVPDAPVIFLKPPSVLHQISQWHSMHELSLFHEDVHYETEIVLQLQDGGYQLSTQQALSCIGAMTIGLDMTRRNLQAQLKKQGHPWTVSKVFPDAAVVGPMIPLEKFVNYVTTPFSFILNNEIKQQSSLEKMTFSPIDLISYISGFFPLCAGDLIFTGTPAGVGQVNVGDKARLAWGDSYWYDITWKKGDNQ